MNSSIVFALALAVIASASARPGFLYSHPIATQDTTVVRDALGNQATAYAYQNGHSAVAVSRNDVSKHLAVVAAPVVTYEHAYEHAPVVHSAPVYQTHAYAAYPNAYSYNPYYNGHYNGHYYY